MDLVDTDVLIDVQRGHPPALAWMSSLTELPAVPGFVVMELIQDARNSKEVRKAFRLVAPFRVIWPGESDCTRALADFAAYNLSHGLGLLDSLIGACAIGVSGRILTFNVKHFLAVPGLIIVQPYTR